ADVELKDHIMVAMPKLVGEGFYTCTIRVEYEWKPPMCACCKIFGHVQDECLKNIDSDVVKNMKKPNQATRGVPVSPNVRFKPVKQVFRQVSKTNNFNTCGHKKKDTEPTIEVSNSNPFDVLHSVENDVCLYTNGRTSDLASKKANSSGKATIMDDEGKPLTKVDSSGVHDSDDEVASVNNDMTNCLASKKVGYGTNSLLE
ncbi:reverse transcriptase domain-containing protein, partial [Tanacetum coccineum]